VRCDDDEGLAVGPQLPQQAEQQRVVEKVHGVAANDHVKSVLECAFCNVLESQSFALLAGTGVVPASEQMVTRWGVTKALRTLRFVSVRIDAMCLNRGKFRVDDASYFPAAACKVKQ
jgi:hypothetical protein